MSRFSDKVAGIDELRFGLTRKLLALMVVSAGIVTFFLPLVSTDPQVMSKSGWSAYDIATYVYQAEMVRSASDLLLFPVEVAAVYLLLAIALYVVVISRTQRKLVHISVVGLALVIYGWNRAAETFENMLYKNYPSAELPPGEHVAVYELMLALLAVMAILLFITAGQFLDGDAQPKLPDVFRVRPDPEFIAAEVVEEGSEVSKPLRLKE